jgi:hypothetical protein
VAREAVHELLPTGVVLEKLGRRGISVDEAEQVPRNDHVTVRNRPNKGLRGRRILLIGLTDGGRLLTLVIERTSEPTSWLLVTGWGSTEVERKILEG